MFTQTDYDKLRQIMKESPEKEELLNRLLTSHQMEISSLSHELRNPLTLVYSALQLIEAGHPEVLTFRHWQSMRCDIEYMQELLDELSAYNNSERLNRKLLDTEAFLKTLALSFAASLTETDVEFTSHIEAGLPAVTGDSVKLRQVLMNLLKNAADAVSVNSDAEGFHPSIALHAHADEKLLRITVTDNGCGISPEHMDNIFEPFVTYKQNGTGLGLALSRRIARAHGGSLTVSSKPGNTCFTLTLPV